MRQEDKVLNYLKSTGKALSGREAEDLFRVRDLPKRISVLRREGHDIQGERKTDVNGGRYIRYTLAAAA